MEVQYKLNFQRTTAILGPNAEIERQPRAGAVKCDKRKVANIQSDSDYVATSVQMEPSQHHLPKGLCHSPSDVEN